MYPWSEDAAPVATGGCTLLGVRAVEALHDVRTEAAAKDGIRDRDGSVAGYGPRGSAAQPTQRSIRRATSSSPPTRLRSP